MIKKPVGEKMPKLSQILFSMSNLRIEDMMVTSRTVSPKRSLKTFDIYGKSELSHSSKE